MEEKNSKLKGSLIKRIAIFSSGKGTLTQAIIENLEPSKVIVTCIVTNNPSAGVVDVANQNNIRLFIIDNQMNIDKQLKLLGVDLIVLSGFLKKVPNHITDKFKVINIHPALLPKFGGKGMYGIHVHRKVIESKEMFSGITIHFVNSEYDEGKIIYQNQIPIYRNWDEYDLEKEVKKLEYKWYPEIIKQVIYDKR